MKHTSELFLASAARTGDEQRTPLLRCLDGAGDGRPRARTNDVLADAKVGDPEVGCDVGAQEQEGLADANHARRDVADGVDLLAVDERVVRRAEIANRPCSAVTIDLHVCARSCVVVEIDGAVATAADDGRNAERDDLVAGSAVGEDDDQPWREARPTGVRDGGKLIGRGVGRWAGHLARIEGIGMTLQSNDRARFCRARDDGACPLGPVVLSAHMKP